MLKRLVITLSVIAVALGGLGLLTARAQDDDAKAYLGVSIADKDEGVTVVEVAADSPADEAGLRAGDVIEAVDGTAIDSPDHLVEVIAGHAPGDEVTLTISWRGDVRDVKVTLAERPEEPQIFTMPNMGVNRPGIRGVLNLLGLELSISDEGVVVEEVDEDSPLADAGLQAGDVITAIEGVSADDNALPALLEALRDEMGDRSLTFTVLRDGEEIDVELDLSTIDLSDLSLGMDLSDLPMFSGRNSIRLGVSYQIITPELQEEKSLPVDQGALVTEVLEDSPAEEAGLQVDDIITAVDDEPVDTEHSLRNRLSSYEAGDTVTLSVLRGGEELTLEVELASRLGVGFGSTWRDGRNGRGMWGDMMRDGEMMERFFKNHPRLGELFDSEMMERFFENHPHMGEWFDMMPGGGMHFYFGPDQSAPDNSDATETGSAA